MHPTEPSIRAATIFFAALVGFGLKHLLDVTQWRAPEIYPHKLICFVLAVVLFLRFLLGSANHLWHEHSRPGREIRTGQLGFDLAALSIFGIIAVCICYAETLAGFFWGSVLLIGTACAWSMVDVGLKQWCSRGHGRWWQVWLPINVFQGAVLGLVAWRTPEMGSLWFGYPCWYYILGLTHLLCLAVDFAFQMHMLKGTADN